MESNYKKKRDKDKEKERERGRGGGGGGGENEFPHLPDVPGAEGTVQYHNSKVKRHFDYNKYSVLSGTFPK